ncbi:MULTISPECIES: hypothetical protein [unclassified Streptomyces]|uniref:hypothetical protein n=1 Tax=unclassified Streptomyces TaxID=2593676 RepID=UPI00380D4135
MAPDTTAARPAGAPGWHFTSDVSAFLARAEEFLGSRPDLHTVHLTVTRQLRQRGAPAYGDAPPFLGHLTRADGSVAAALLHTPPYALRTTRLTAAESESLAERLHTSATRSPRSPRNARRRRRSPRPGSGAPGRPARSGTSNGCTTWTS